MSISSDFLSIPLRVGGWVALGHIVPGWRLVCWCRQKKQRESERDETEVKSSEAAVERMLFHGIKWRHFDSVARSNIDWRTTGFSHGVMFGQGKSTQRSVLFMSIWHRLTCFAGGLV